MPVASLSACALSLALAAEPRGAAVLQVHGYLAGLIASLDLAVDVGPHRLTVGVGYNATDRRDFGVNDSERGGGPGVAVAYQLGLERLPWAWLAPVAVGLRVDLWFLTIAWADGGERGRTSVTVLQPTAELSYRVRLGSAVTIQPGLGLGAEINTQTRGAPVGQGAILLVRLKLVLGR